MKLNDVDVMISDTALLYLMGVAQHNPLAFDRSFPKISFYISLVDNTLVFQTRVNPSHKAIGVPSILYRPEWGQVSGLK